VTAPADRLCLLRGAGDLATGVAWRLTRAGFPVVATELATPLTVRRTVALSTAVTDGSVDIEGMIGHLASSEEDAVSLAGSGVVAVLVSPELPDIEAAILVDARLAKRNIDTTIDDADLVVGLGPGFAAGIDCDAVVETLRGPRLGRAIWAGSAEPDTGTPGTIAGRTVERVLRAPVAGRVEWSVPIGDQVVAGQELGTVAGVPVAAEFDGVVRGLVLDGSEALAGLKIGDVDPRRDASWQEISDKALAIGGGVLEAVMAWPNRSR
jgi:xanthine dehydrogenase accessory factor